MFPHQKHSFRFGKTYLAALVLCCVLGCNNDGPKRVVVQGEVTLEQKPVEDGQIRFIPQGNDAGPLTIAPIRAGRYRCEHNGGVPVGTHRVEILVWDPSVPEPKGPGQPGRPQWAPDEYNKQSKLVTEISAEEGDVVQDFQL